MKYFSNYRVDIRQSMCAAIAVLSFVTVTVAHSAESTSPSAAEAALLKAEDQLFEADVKHDVAAISRGFADEAIFVHANGRTQTKADYLRATESSTSSFVSVTGQDRVVRIFGDVGVIRGTKNVVVGEMRLSGSYLAVYIKRDGRWQMLNSQSTPAPRNVESK